MRTEDVKQRVLSIRFKRPELDMNDIRDLLEKEGEIISARSVARILSEHGVTLKKRKKRSRRVRAGTAYWQHRKRE